MNIMTHRGYVFRFWACALCLSFGAGAAFAQGTPQLALDGLVYMHAKGIDPGCGTGIVTDGSFEATTGTEFWDHYSNRHGNVICNQFCDPKSPNQANTGNNWLSFRNDPSVAEHAYAQQTVVLPQAPQGYLNFYVRGSADHANLEFSIYIDNYELVYLDGNFTALYQEYVPIAIDLSLFLDGEPHVLRFDMFMDPGTYTYVYIDDVCIETFGGTEGEGEGETCHEICSGPQGPDVDGDGLGADCEACHDTKVDNADSDGDGMDDGYEVRNGLSPNNPADARLELDGDGLTNVEEYRQNSNPFNIDDPFTVRFVSHNGTDTPERGSAGSPWQTIQYAIDNTPASAAKPAVITLLPGTYFETVFLKPYVTVRSSAPLNGIIYGTVVGAENSALQQVSITGGASPLLYINDVGMTITGCRIEPDSSKKGTGLVGAYFEGQGAGNTSISGCSFVGCDIALDIYGDVPSLRKSQVTGWFEVGVWIHDNGKSFEKMGSIGDETNPDVGYNDIFGGVNGPAVRYERDETFLCENIYWGTTDLDEISNLIEGNADFTPFLATSSILPASIFCTVINGADQSRITNATVTVAPSIFAPITDNLNGVYSLNAVPDGTYTIRASAPPLPDATETLFVDAGELASVVLVLGADANPNPNPQCCNNGKTTNPADVLVALSAPLTMLLAGLYLRRNG